MKQKQIFCCTNKEETTLDKDYWDSQYLANTVGWDIGKVSPPIKNYIDTINNKKAKILIPGCGNAYEAEYLLKEGFINITVIDISPTLVNKLKEKFKGIVKITIIQGDFFQHYEKYDYIIEQTFFCALPPFLRQKYVWKTHQLLNKKGILFGLLFNREFEKSPPFGGNKVLYIQLFNPSFELKKISEEQHSIPARLNSELFIECKKDSNKKVNLYQFDGITCDGCKAAITKSFLELPGVLQVSFSSDYTNVLIVSEKELSIDILKECVAYDNKYVIEKI